MIRGHAHPAVVTAVADQFARGTMCRAQHVVETRVAALLAQALRAHGVLILRDGRWYLSTAHTADAIDTALAALERSLAAGAHTVPCHFKGRRAH